MSPLATEMVSVGSQLWGIGQSDDVVLGDKFVKETVAEILLGLLGNGSHDASRVVSEIPTPSQDASSQALDHQTSGNVCDQSGELIAPDSDFALDQFSELFAANVPVSLVNPDFLDEFLNCSEDEEEKEPSSSYNASGVVPEVPAPSLDKSARSPAPDHVRHDRKTSGHGGNAGLEDISARNVVEHNNSSQLDPVEESCPAEAIEIQDDDRVELSSSNGKGDKTHRPRKRRPSGDNPVTPPSKKRKNDETKKDKKKPSRRSQNQLFTNYLEYENLWMNHTLEKVDHMREEQDRRKGEFDLYGLEWRRFKVYLRCAQDKLVRFQRRDSIAYADIQGMFETVREEVVRFDAFTLRFFERNEDCDSKMAKLLEATKLYIQDCGAQEEKVTKHLA